MYLWNTNHLAEALGRQELTGAQKFQYILIFHAIYAVAGYIAWLFVRSSTGWVFWFEGIVSLVITIVGLQRCRERYSIAIQDRFVEDCILLQVPIAIKFFVFFWLAHEVTAYSLHWLVPLLQPETYDEARRTNHLISSIYSIYPFMIYFASITLFYIRLGHHMETAARAQHP